MGEDQEVGGIGVHDVKLLQKIKKDVKLKKNWLQVSRPTLVSGLEMSVAGRDLPMKPASSQHPFRETRKLTRAFYLNGKGTETPRQIQRSLSHLPYEDIE